MRGPRQESGEAEALSAPNVHCPARTSHRCAWKCAYSQRCSVSDEGTSRDLLGVATCVTGMICISAAMSKCDATSGDAQTSFARTGSLCAADARLATRWQLIKRPRWLHNSGGPLHTWKAFHWHATFASQPWLACVRAAKSVQPTKQKIALHDRHMQR